MQPDMMLRIIFKSDEINILDYANPREIRREISKQRKLGNIYIPIGDYVYRKIELCSPEQVENFIHSQMAHLKTLYHSTLKPLKNYVDDEKLSALFGHFEGLENG